MREEEKYIERRYKVLNQIAQKPDIDERVIEAMKRVPRQCFVDESLAEMAYHDRPLPIAAGQTISQIYTVAMQTSLLQPQPYELVLEIGTGCGYQTAVLCELGSRVYSIERVEELYLAATNNLQKLNYSPTLIYGDGFEGLPNHAPFDAILITCGAPDIPDALLEQLVVGGRMVAPIGRDIQEMMVIIKTDRGNKIERKGSYKFVPMLSGKVDTQNNKKNK